MAEYTEGIDRCLDRDHYVAWRSYANGREVRVQIPGPKMREAVKYQPMGRSAVEAALEYARPLLDAKETEPLTVTIGA